MKQLLTLLLAFGLIAVTSIVQAGTIPFKKARLLKRGMSAGEVLYLVGPPDYRTLRDRYWTNKQTWFYIPGQKDRQPWQTVIQFDAYGYVQRIDRDKIIRDGY